MVHWFLIVLVLSLWMEAILKDMFPLMCDPQHAAVLRSKPPAVGRYIREGVVAPIVEWYTRDHKTGKLVANLCMPTVTLKDY